MLYDVILWDVDDTLLDFAYSKHQALVKSLGEIGVEATEELIDCYTQINDRWWKRLEKGEVTKAELLPGRFTELFAVYDIKCPDIDAFLKHFQDYLGTLYKPIENSLEVCRALKGKCRQYVVTNGVTRTQLSKLKLSGFYDLMDDIFISEQLGAPKPSRQFFDRVFETMPEVNKNKVLIVGDSLTSDMRGGNNAGIHTCWYNPRNEFNETAAEINYMIWDLKEVLLIVEG